MIDYNATILLIMLSVNVTKVPTERQWFLNLKSKTQIYAVYKYHLKYKDTGRFKVKGC